MKTEWKRLRHMLIFSLCILMTIATVYALCGPDQYDGYTDDNQTWQDANVDVWDCPEYEVHYVVVQGSARLDDNGTWQYKDTVSGDDRFEKGTRVFIVDEEGNCWIEEL
jgi:hypothetical protein